MTWRKVKVPRDVAGTGIDMKCYELEIGDGRLYALVGREPIAGQLRWHLSLSHTALLRDGLGRVRPGRIPTWAELTEARYHFVPDDVTMALLLPPVEKFKRIHPTTMNLWEIDSEIPSEGGLM